jgi:CBS domain-containing protein
MTLSDVMTNNLVKLDVDSTAAEAARLMKEKIIGDVVVTEGDRLAVERDPNSALAGISAAPPTT